jgi:hypothetical protein
MMNSSSPLPPISSSERMELDRLHRIISSSITSISSQEQARFAMLFAKSLHGKGDRPLG